MFSQTIALIRYQLLGILNSRLLAVLLVLFVIVVLSGQFVSQLALINVDSIANAVMADLIRYCLVFMMLVTVCYQIAQDYELQFFDRLLAMPVNRYQYILAQLTLVTVLAALLVLPVFLVLGISDMSAAVYWSAAVFLELILVGQIASLVSVSLEKLPVALMASLAFYLFSKSLPLIGLILIESAPFYEEEASFQFYRIFFDSIQFLVPAMDAFAQNNLLFVEQGQLDALVGQLVTIVIYSLFLQCIMLVDFYRKEFNAS